MENKKKGIVIGIVGGFLNGMFGSGGGTIVVPALQKFLKVCTHKSHATAIAIILPLSIVSAVVYFKGSEVDYMTLLLVSVGGVVGGFIGAKLLTKLSASWIHKIFGFFMVVAAVRMIFG